MQLYDIGDWIKVQYYDSTVKYLKALPKDMIDVYRTEYLSDSMLHRETHPAVITYYRAGYAKCT